GSEHGEIPCGEGLVGSGQCLLADVRRLRFCERIRRRAQVSRDAPISSCADLDQSDSVVRRRARARPAEIVLMSAAGPPQSANYSPSGGSAAAALATEAASVGVVV